MDSAEQPAPGTAPAPAPAPASAGGPPKPEKGVTVNIVVHNPEHMKYMSKIGIDLMYFCKECPYYSQALLDVTSHVASSHEMEAMAGELSEASTLLADLSHLKPRRQEHNYSIKTVSKKNLATCEPSLPTVVLQEQPKEFSSSVMSKVRIPKPKQPVLPKTTVQQAETIETDQGPIDVEPVDFNFVPREFFCSKCPYTVMYSVTEMEQHTLCHGNSREPTRSQSGDIVSSSTENCSQLSCYMCRPGRGKNMISGSEVNDRSKGHVWHHLKEHLHQRHNINYQISCKLCDKVFKSHVAFKSHRASHLVKCVHSFCKYSSVSKEDMATHQKCHMTGQEKMYACYLCGYQCKRDPGKWSVMHAHLVARHKGSIEPLYSCYQCMKGFQCLRQYRVHLRSCQRISHLICTICNQEFHPDLLASHLKSHDTEYDEQVAFENEEIKTEMKADVDTNADGEQEVVETVSNTLAAELDDKINSSITVFVCDLHSQVFSNKDDFTAHLATEHTDMMLSNEAMHALTDSTDVKGKLSPKKLTLDSKCKICYKKFQSEDRLLKHVSRVHSKEFENVPCTLCGRHFKNKIRLRNHVREVHEGQKRKKVEKRVKTDKPVQYHICETCGYTTPSTLRLRNHQLSVHQGIIPYHCDKCDFKTSEKSDFYRHKWRHNTAKKYSCSSCSYKTNTRWVMVNHAWKQHGVQLPKQSKDTMGCIWSKRWQNKLRKMTATFDAPALQGLDINGKSQQESLYLPTELLSKEDNQIPISESYLQNMKMEHQVICEELVSHENVVSQEMIQEGSVLFDPANVEVREVIVDPSTEVSDNVVYLPDTDLSEATEAALLLLAVGPNQTVTE